MGYPKYFSSGWKGWARSERCAGTRADPAEEKCSVLPVPYGQQEPQTVRSSLGNGSNRRDKNAFSLSLRIQILTQSEYFHSFF